MIEIIKKNKSLVLKYYSDYQPSDWIEEKLKKDELFSIQSIFKVNRSLLLEKVQEDYDEPEFHFVIGKLIDDYYKINKNVLGLKNNFFFFKKNRHWCRTFFC